MITDHEAHGPIILLEKNSALFVNWTYSNMPHKATPLAKEDCPVLACSLAARYIWVSYDSQAQYQNRIASGVKFLTIHNAVIPEYPIDYPGWATKQISKWLLSKEGFLPDLVTYTASWNNLFPKSNFKKGEDLCNDVPIPRTPRVVHGKLTTWIYDGLFTLSKIYTAVWVHGILWIINK
jgi:hypothetical protein